MLTRYTTEQFLNLLEEKIEEAGGVNALAAKLKVDPPRISQTRRGRRNPDIQLLNSLGLRREMNYVANATEEKNTDDER